MSFLKGCARPLGFGIVKLIISGKINRSLSQSVPNALTTLLVECRLTSLVDRCWNRGPQLLLVADRKCPVAMQGPPVDTDDGEPIVTRRSVLTTAGATLGTIVLPTAVAQSTGDGWYGYGCNRANTAVNPESNEIDTQPTRQWELNVKSPVRSGITAVEGNVYTFGSNGDVYSVDDAENVQVFAVDAASGSGADGPTATPLFDDGALYVGGLDGSAYALDTETQSELWSTSIGEPIRASPTAGDKTVYVATTGGTVTALDAVSGSKQWSTTVPGTVTATPALSDSDAQDTALYVADDTGAVTILDANSGDKKRAREPVAAIEAAPTLGRDRAFVATTDGTVIAFRLTTGENEWKQTLPGSIVTSPVFADVGRGGTTIYVADRDGTVSALDPADGTERWNSTIEGEIVGDPAATSDSLYLATRDGTVRALDRDDGSQRWSLALDRTVVAPLSVANGTLYVGTADGHIVAITRDSGIVATALSYGEAAAEFARQNGTTLGGVAGASLATIGGYAGLKRFQSSDGKDETDHTGPTPPSTGDAEPIADLPTTAVRQPDLSDVSYEDFDVQELIGSGGSADVHRATIEVNSREHTVALKTPRMSDYETVDADFFAEFVEEAEIWENIDDHEAIVAVLGWGKQPYPWIALEHMDAGNLEELREDMDTEAAIAHLERLCDGVHHAHRHGVTHTDLKPENVLYTTVNGALVPKVTDWGLANVLIEHSTTVEGMTPAYAAPEQIEPDGYGGTDDRTDIYQLGVVAYELLTGQRPFDRDSYTATMNAILNESPTPPAELDTSVDQTLSEAVLRALEKDKDRRYETVLHFRDALRRSYHEGEQ